MSFILRTIVWSVAALIATPAIAQGPVVRAPIGAVEGEAKEDLLVFKGLPYALPPVGAARWKPPVAIPAWSEVRNAKRFAPACVQPRPRPGSIYANEHAAMSEDCLFLNVWAPKEARKAPDRKSVV